ncbi:hypothetical protein [Psychrobium sp. 1_MG-2023]|uniref:hypothetical protein n=1 Tax=Psychrobium sp. 1_MG-2023 TaxID=3062624 RepID=UPI000C3277F5|nr:hypothetical protein [Psychrobium sp. 1_MG-2023]MDP2562759.1 hypothetical protein [Psychrobium sp. 1_MG-2023]PKF57686.1 hypothetical protein CW748_05695 [Alteromonadales bacterium alter-6D02]
MQVLKGFTMALENDYYGLLGLIPRLDGAVLQRAYDLAKQVCEADTMKSFPRAESLDEAYAILSQKEPKKEYDNKLAANLQAVCKYKITSEIDIEYLDKLSASLDDEWLVATKYKPVLLSLEQSLAKFSPRLAYTFRVQTLVNQSFESPEQVAKELNKLFLCSYFGTNTTVIKFAKQLLLEKQEEASLELNKVIMVMGDKLQPQVIIDQLVKDYGLSIPEQINSPGSVEVKQSGRNSVSFSSLDSLVFYLFLSLIALIFGLSLLFTPHHDGVLRDVLLTLVSLIAGGTFVALTIKIRSVNRDLKKQLKTNADSKAKSEQNEGWYKSYIASYSDHYVVGFIALIMLIAIVTNKADEKTRVTQKKNWSTVEQVKVCKVYIGKLFHKQPSIITHYRTDGNNVYVRYVRSLDNTTWSYVCNTEGNKMVWAGYLSDTKNWGRWRFEDEITLSYNNEQRLASFLMVDTQQKVTVHL